MADAVWPPGLPQAPRLADLQETPPQLSVRTEMDTGPAKIRRRFVAGYTTWQMSLSITRNQRSTLLDFYLETCQGGSLPFDWKNPVTHAPATFRWVERPVVRPLAMLINGSEPYLAVFVLEEMPSISNAVIVPPGSPELPPWLLVRDDEADLFIEDIEYGYETAGGVHASTTMTTGPGGGPSSTPYTGKIDPSLPGIDGTFHDDITTVNPIPGNNSGFF